MGLYPEHMTIEEIRAALSEIREELHRSDSDMSVERVIDSIVVIRSKAYNDGWHDAITEMDGEL